MIDGKLLVEKLLTYAEEFLHLEKLDVIYTRNLLLREFKLDAPIEDAGDLSYICEYKVPDELVQRDRLFRPRHPAPGPLRAHRRGCDNSIADEESVI